METITLQKNFIDHVEQIDKERLDIRNKIILLNGKILKIYTSDDEKYLANKKAKLEIASTLPINSRPKALVEVDGKFKGFISDNLGKSLNEQPISKTDIITILEELKKQIIIMHTKGIIHGDISKRNILKDNDQVSIIDIDDCYYSKSLDFDILSNITKTYLAKVRQIDERLDNYLINIVSLSMYQKTMEELSLYCSKENGLPKQLNNKENKEILKKMLNLNRSYEGNLFTQTKRVRK